MLRQTLSGGASVELDLSDRAQAQAYLIRRYEPEIIALLTLERSGFTQRDIVSLLSGYGYGARAIPPVGAQRLRRRSVESSCNLLFVPE